MADKFGLTNKEIALINSVFKKYPQIKEVKIFGSRAIGTYRLNSDIDLVLCDKLEKRILGNIILDLDDLPMPYMFDVKAMDEINHPKLLEHIEKHGEIFYQIN